MNPKYLGLYRALGGALVYMTDYVDATLLTYRQLGFLLNNSLKPAIQLFYDANGDTRDYFGKNDYNLMRCLSGNDEFTSLVGKINLKKVEEAKNHVMSRVQTDVKG